MLLCFPSFVNLVTNLFIAASALVVQDTMSAVGLEARVSKVASKPAGHLLLLAATEGDTALCQTLILEQGASVHFRNAVGETPLCLAVRRGLVSVVELLLRYGSDPNVATTAPCGGQTPLHLAVATGNRRIMSVLLNSNADPNVPDAQGKLPLHDACMEGQEGTARLLLSHGSVASAADKTGSTPLDYAMRKKHAQCCFCVNAAVAERGDGDVNPERPTASVTASGKPTNPYLSLAQVSNASAFAAYRDELQKSVQWREKVVPKARK